MKLKHKPCSVDGCTQPRFARGWCKYHYNLNYLLPKQKEKPRQIVPIKRRTDQRSKEEKQYLVKRLAFIVAQRALHPLGWIFCIFCGKKIYGEPDLHHGDGRDDDKLLDEKDWFLAHHNCHVDEYHSKSWTLLSWWLGYINRIKISHPHIYQKELNKMEK